MKKGQSANSGGRDSAIANDFGLKVFGRKILLFLVVLILGLVMNAMVGGRVFAATSGLTLYNKALAGSLQKCYSDVYMKDSISDASVIYNVKDVIIDQSDGVIKVPYGYGNSLKDGDISCVELFAGWQGMKIFTGSAEGLLGKNAWDIGGSDLLDKLGYVVANDAGNASSKCVSFDYDLKGTRHTNRLCYRINDDGTVSPMNPEFYEGERQNEDIEIWMQGSNLMAATSEGRMNYIFQFTGPVSASDFEANMYSAASNLGELLHNGANPQNVKPNFGGGDGGNNSFAAYKIDNWNIAAERALKNLTSFNSFEETKFSQQDKYDMYMGYLTGIYNGFVTSTCSDNKNESNQSVPVSVDGETKWCVVGGDFSSEDKYVNVFTKNEDRFLDLTTNSAGLIEAIRELNVEELTLTAANPTTGAIGQTVTGGSSSNGKDDPCRDNSGALGWLVCPVITWVGETLNTVYEEMVEPFLKVDPKLVSSEGGTYQAWEIFRNIANIVFVILFLIVIFSQITGVGIDNYGIKRILPKLIIVAILINLSYIICQLAVDLSNIIGSGANVALSNIASRIPSNMTGDFTSGLWFKHVLNSLLVVVGAGEVAGVALTVSAGLAVSGLILPLLFGLFTALISVICFFALLGMRQAAVVVLVAIAPLAFVCYMLPNTKKIFDKWLKIFEGMLLLYPICGLIIGGSALASKVIIGSTDNFFVYLIGLMVLVVPFFFIPKLLMNSFNALGNIGAKLMNAGNRFARRETGAADKAIRNSKGFQEREQYRKNRADLRRAERIRDRLNRRIDRGLAGNEREELQNLRQKIRSGEELNAGERERYNELIGKSNNKLSDFQQKRLSEANAMIRESESNRDKARYGADETVVAGQMQSDKYMNQRAAEEASDWTEQYFRGNDGSVWVSDRNGNYVTVDKDGVRRTRTVAEIAEMARKNQGAMISRREAMLNRDEVMRAKQTGQLAGYANASRAEAASKGARLSSVEASQAEMIRDIQSGQDAVLQIQHDDNVAKRRELAGKAEARTSLSESPVAATEVYARRAANEYNLAQAGNRIEVTPEITPEYAGSLATQRFNTSQERMYSEQLVNNNRAQSLADLAGAIGGGGSLFGSVAGSQTGGGHVGDINYIMAAIKDVVAKGGIEDLNNLIKDASPVISSPQNRNVARAIGNFMATMSVEPAMKAYGKSIANLSDSDLIPSYSDWLNAADSLANDPGGKFSLAGFIRANGNTVLVNASKDTAKFYNADPVLMDKFSAVQIWNGVASARDNETRIAFNNLLMNKIKNGTAQDQRTKDPNKIRQEIVDAASNTQWANMEESSFRALLGLADSDDISTAFTRLDPILQKSFRDAKARLDKAGGTVKANMRGKVREFFDKIP